MRADLDMKHGLEAIVAEWRKENRGTKGSRMCDWLAGGEDSKVMAVCVPTS